MELGEHIDTINFQLENLYGFDATSHLPIFRVVWSEDQYEKRMMDTTDEGLFVSVPQVREVPKYRQWIHERYVLERLVLVPDFQREELADIKISYEPLYVFQNSHDDSYLPPRIDAAKFIIDLIYAVQGKSSMRKYVDDEITPEKKEQRIQQLMMELFGNETTTTDALTYGTGVVVPNSYGVKES